jgi:hypothetical protein
MAERLVHPGIVSINSEQYKLKEPIRPKLINKYAPKIVTGETTGDSQVGRSRIEWSDNRGGIGIDRITDVEAANSVSLDRSWYSSAYLRHKGHLTLPPLAVTTSASGEAGILTVGAIAELSDKIYAAYSTKVFAYAFTSDDWGSAVHTLPAVATDAITLRLGGTVYMVFAHTGGTSDTVNGSSWNDRTDDVRYMAEWDDRLWGIDNIGQLRFCQSIGTWVNDAQLPLPDGYVTDLYVDRDAAGEPILYAATKVGLYAHDAANARFLKTELELPFHNDAGRGVTRWRGAAYYPAGLGVYRYQAGPSASVAVVGPDRDDGLPDDRRGTIVRLEQSHNDLLALVDSTSSTASGLDVLARLEDNAAQVIDTSAGVSSILAWDSRGWQVLWESAKNTESITYSLVSNAYNGYRLWWGHNRRVHYMDLPVDIVNPSETTDRSYASSATHDFPWLVVGQETSGLALRLRVQVADASSDETVTPSYATNFSDSFTALTAITSDGITTYDFPDSTTPTGTAFRSFRPRLELARGDSAAASPDVVSVTLEWRKKLPAQYAWSLVLDLSERHGNRSPMQQRADLTTAASSNTLVEFTFRDDTGNDRNYYVDVVEHGGLEFTGHDERGVVELLLAEV